jgi:uncharacterized protein
LTEGLVVFFKSPRLGEVKSRLASTLGKERALEVYKGLLATSLSVAQDWVSRSPESRRLFPFGSGDRDGYSEAGFPVARPQVGSDLGLRMERAIRESLRSCDRVAIIGTDCPWFTVEDLESAFSGLKAKEVRLGPCPDGGYWLMSLSSLSPGSLSHLPWSESTTRSRVSRRMVGHGYEVKMLKELRDVDVESDLHGVDLA